MITPIPDVYISNLSNNNKAPGPDDIGPKLLKQITVNITSPLQYIFNLPFWW